MPNMMRWRYGDTNPVILPVEVGHTVEIGDLVYLDVDSARPISSLPDLGTLAANQEAMHDQFLGVAMQASGTGGADAVRIATSGVFEFQCVTEAFEVGDLIGGREEGTGTQLDKQIVTGVARKSSDRPVREAGTNTRKQGSCRHRKHFNARWRTSGSISYRSFWQKMRHHLV